MDITNDEDAEYSYPLHLQGACSTLPAAEVNDTIAKLHAVIKEITGKDVEVPVKARIGFLP